MRLPGLAAMALICAVLSTASQAASASEVKQPPDSLDASPPEGASFPSERPSGTDMLKLAQSEGCFSCHAIDHKKVGPAYTAVAQRYAHNPNAAAILQDAILNGHQGTWGVIPMPAYAPDGYLNSHQALNLAHWILSLKPKS